jgi:hypothetical protein
VIVTDVLKPEEAFCVQDLALRNGKILMGINMGYNFNLETGILITGIFASI